MVSSECSEEQGDKDNREEGRLRGSVSHSIQIRSLTLDPAVEDASTVELSVCGVSSSSPFQEQNVEHL